MTDALDEVNEAEAEERAAQLGIQSMSAGTGPLVPQKCESTGNQQYHLCPDCGKVDHKGKCDLSQHQCFYCGKRHPDSPPAPVINPDITASPSAGKGPVINNKRKPKSNEDGCVHGKKCKCRIDASLSAGKGPVVDDKKVDSGSADTTVSKGKSAGNPKQH